MILHIGVQSLLVKFHSNLYIFKGRRKRHSHPPLYAETFYKQFCLNLQLHKLWTEPAEQRIERVGLKQPQSVPSPMPSQWWSIEGRNQDSSIARSSLYYKESSTWETGERSNAYMQHVVEAPMPPEVENKRSLKLTCSISRLSFTVMVNKNNNKARKTWFIVSYPHLYPFLPHHLKFYCYCYQSHAHVFWC